MTIGEELSHGDPIWDYVPPVNFQLRQPTLKVAQLENKIAANVLVAMNSSGCRFVLSIHVRGSVKNN